jgi:hypothetical protein
LLIGNSIVLGGNPINHDDKLGPLLEKEGCGCTVAAGGWTNVNEMVYLDRNPDVLQNADTVIVENMGCGPAGANPWPGGYYVFPDHKPWLLTSYIFRKYVPGAFLGFTTSDFYFLACDRCCGRGSVAGFQNADFERLKGPDCRDFHVSNAQGAQRQTRLA